MGKIKNTKMFILILWPSAPQSTALDTRVSTHVSTFVKDFVTYMCLNYSHLKTSTLFHRNEETPFYSLLRYTKEAHILWFSYWSSLTCHLKWHAIGSGSSCRSGDLFFPCCLPCPWGLTFPRETSTQTHPQTPAFLSLTLQGKSCSVVPPTHISGCLVLICGPWSPLAQERQYKRSQVLHPWQLTALLSACQSWEPADRRLSPGNGLWPVPCHSDHLILAYWHWLLHHGFLQSCTGRSSSGEVLRVSSGEFGSLAPLPSLPKAPSKPG